MAGSWRSVGHGALMKGINMVDICVVSGHAGSAEADVRSAETIAQQRARIAELEGQAGALQRQLAAAHQQAQALEGRLAAAEAAAAKAAEEVGGVWAGTGE